MVLGVTALSLFAGSRTIFRTVFMARRAPFHLAAGRDRIGMDGVRISISSGAQSTRFVTRAKLSVSLTLLRAHG
jgi:hypothetical protein